MTISMELKSDDNLLPSRCKRANLTSIYWASACYKGVVIYICEYIKYVIQSQIFVFMRGKPFARKFNCINIMKYFCLIILSAVILCAIFVYFCFSLKIFMLFAVSYSEQNVATNRDAKTIFFILLLIQFKIFITFRIVDSRWRLLYEHMKFSSRSSSGIIVYHSEVFNELFQMGISTSLFEKSSFEILYRPPCDLCLVLDSPTGVPTTCWCE